MLTEAERQKIILEILEMLEKLGCIIPETAEPDGNGGADR